MVRSSLKSPRGWIMSTVQHLTVAEKNEILNSKPTMLVVGMIVSALNGGRVNGNVLQLDLNYKGLSKTENIQEVNVDLLPDQLITRIGKLDTVIYELLETFNKYHFYHGIDEGMEFLDFNFEVTFDVVFDMIDSLSDIERLFRNNGLERYIETLNDIQKREIKILCFYKLSPIEHYVMFFKKTWSDLDHDIIESNIDSLIITNYTINSLYGYLNVVGEELFKKIFYQWGINNNCFEGFIELKPDIYKLCDREYNKLKLLYGYKIAQG